MCGNIMLTVFILCTLGHFCDKISTFFVGSFFAILTKVVGVLR